MGLVPVDERVVVACSLLDLFQVEVEDLLLALPEAVALPDELVLSALEVVLGVAKGLSGARWKPLACLLVQVDVVGDLVQVIVEGEAEWPSVGAGAKAC